MRVAIVVVGLFFGACINSSSVPCGDATCPGGTVCEPVRQLCILPDQQTVCSMQSLGDGRRCEGAGFTGVCQNNICLPGCGDSVTRQPEECDDGNFASHDGCSSACLVETPTWLELEQVWRGSVGHTAAYHASNGRLIMIGGVDEQGLRSELWQRTSGGGALGWQEITDRFTVRPPPRRDAMMAYDSGRQALVLFGGRTAAGALDDTWEYAPDPSSSTGASWTKKQLTASPENRSDGAMAYDVARARVVLYGGRNGTTTYGDTWEYNGATWTQVAQGGALPPARHSPAMAYDPAGPHIVMFGGLGSTMYGDTWAFNGAWTPLSVSGSPSARHGMSMALFTPTAGPNRLVMFGGALADFSIAGDTWEYAAGAWTRVATTLTPRGRVRASLSFDPGVRDATSTTFGGLVLIGGSANDGSPPLTDIWEYTGQWAQHSPRFAPPSRFGPMTYIPSLDEPFVVGGFGAGGATNDVWVYLGGTAWARLNENGAPPKTAAHALGYDRLRHSVVMFGAGGGDSASDRTFVLERDMNGDGSNAWSEVPRTWDGPALSRVYSATAWDGASGKLVLFGGEQNGSPVADTWEFDGTTWSLKAGTTPGPAATRSAAMAWDSAQRKLVLFDSAGATWIYESPAWTRMQETEPVAPRGRSHAAMTFDYQRQRLVLVGGIPSDDTSLTDVWELDMASGAWRELFLPPGGPLPRADFGFAPHRTSRSLLLFGGSSSGGHNGDTWRLQYRSATPDEDCNRDDNGQLTSVDDDIDLQPATTDPDCFGYEKCNEGGDEDGDGAINEADTDCQ